MAKVRFVNTLTVSRFMSSAREPSSKHWKGPGRVTSTLANPRRVGTRGIWYLSRRCGAISAVFVGLNRRQLAQGGSRPPSRPCLGRTYPSASSPIEKLRASAQYLCRQVMIQASSPSTQKPPQSNTPRPVTSKRIVHGPLSPVTPPDPLRARDTTA